MKREEGKEGKGRVRKREGLGWVGRVRKGKGRGGREGGGGNEGSQFTY